MNQMHADEIHGVAREISALARELAPETERQRRLADELLSRLRGSGLMLAGVPRDVGGLELAPGVALRCAEELARGDASAGWCLSIAATSGLPAAYLSDDSRAELFGDPQEIPAGVWAPRGKARPVDGGILVSGRWAYCSGITHAAVFFAGCIVDSGPMPSLIAIPQDELEILDTWHTLGLRGTGSHDAVADELFVPAARVSSLLDGPVVDTPAVPLPGLRLLRALDRRGRTGKRSRDDGRVHCARCAEGRAGVDAHARAALGDASGGRRGGGLAARGAGDVLRGRSKQPGRRPR